MYRLTSPNTGVKAFDVASKTLNLFEFAAVNFLPERNPVFLESADDDLGHDVPATVLAGVRV